MSKEDWEKNNIVKIFKDAGLWNIGEDITILDVACGLSLRSKFIPARARVGVDIYDKYFKYIETNVPYTIVKGDVRNLRKLFPSKSFDLVIALDIVEHLHKDEAVEMIKQCEDIARVAVIIETPEGFIPQDMDILGYGGDEWQTHRSEWSLKDFTERGYKAFTRDYKMTNVKRHSKIDVGTDIKLIDAIKYV